MPQKLYISLIFGGLVTALVVSIIYGKTPQVFMSVVEYQHISVVQKRTHESERLAKWGFLLTIMCFSLHHEVDHQVEALQEMFKKFVDDSGDTECRLNMIQQFLVPLLLEASMPAVTRFYAETIQTIIDFLEEPLQLNDSERMVTICYYTYNMGYLLLYHKFPCSLADYHECFWF